MGRQQDGIYRDKQGDWWVDKVYRGTRLRQCFGQNLKEGQSWLIHQLEQLRQSHLFGTHVPSGHLTKRRRSTCWTISTRCRSRATSTTLNG